MKTKTNPARFLVAMAVLLCIVLLGACSLFQKPGTSKLLLKLSFTLEPARARDMTPQAKQARTARTITPSDSWKIAQYNIDGLHSDGTSVSLKSAETSLNLQLKPGDWAFTVKAFTQAGQEVACGTQSARLQPGRSATLVVNLLPLEGNGSLELSISSSYPLAQGEKITGSLNFLGLPGHPDSGESPPIPIEIQPGQSVLTLPSVQAGYHELSLCLVDSNNDPSGGLAEVVLVLAGFQTKASCTVEVGASGLSFSPKLADPSPLSTPVCSVKHVLARGSSIAPLVVLTDGGPAEEISSSWYFNGRKHGSSLSVSSGGILPATTLVCPPTQETFGLSKLQASFIGRSTVSGRAVSTSVSYDLIDGPAGSWSSWVSGYDYRAAVGPSLFRGDSDGDNGTGNKASVRGLASSPQGLVAIAGLDSDSALHAFVSPAGQEVGAGGAGDSEPSKLPPSASWMRLWRDQIKVEGSAKNADVLAFSCDGSHLAATQSGSTAGWLKIYALDAGGDIQSTFTTTPNLGAPTGLRELKALCFSNDSARLYTIGSPDQTIFSYAEDGQTWVCRSTLAIPEAGAGSQNLKDLEVTTSGAIVVSSGEASKLFVFNDDGTGLLSLGQTIVPGTGSHILNSPSSIAASLVCDRFYVLNDKDEILIYGRAETAAPYSLQSGLKLPTNVSGASCLSVGSASPDSSEEILCVVGGADVGFYKVDAAGNFVGSDSIRPDAGNASGLGGASAVCHSGVTFFVGGGSSGMVSVLSAGE